MKARGKARKTTKLHYRAEPNVSLCGRFPDRLTREKSKVTCKDCRKLLRPNRASIAQFVGR